MSPQSGGSELEQRVGNAVMEAAKLSSQAGQAARKIISQMSSEMADMKGYDVPPIDLIDTNEEIIAMIALPGIAKENIDLAVTEDTLSITAKAMPRTASYLRREMSPEGFKREIKLPVEVKPEQVKARFDNGILEVRLPKLVVTSATTVQVQ
jgi:HSP20 family protein